MFDENGNMKYLISVVCIQKDDIIYTHNCARKHSSSKCCCRIILSRCTWRFNRAYQLGATNMHAIIK